MLRSRDEVLAAVHKHFERYLADEVAGLPSRWPQRIALGRMSQEELVSHMVEVSTYVAALRVWEAKNDVAVTWTTRIAGGSQTIPTHVTIGSIDHAAAIIGSASLGDLAAARDRVTLLRERFCRIGTEDVAQVLKATKTWDDVDFSLLVEASAWFALHDASGLTPRQVPLAGFHAKWLNATGRQALIRKLCGKDDLGLVRPPASVAYAYLDPTYLAAGGRRYDSYVIGDAYALPYRPRAAIVVENQDTFRYFPPVNESVCVYGAGHAGVTHVGNLPWIADVTTLAYWGDMDASGLEILDDYRSRGLNMHSLLMDVSSFRAYERFGTTTATGRQPLAAHRARHLEHLAEDEYALYDLLHDPSHAGPLRVEQERIPLEDAHAAFVALLANDTTTNSD